MSNAPHPLQQLTMQIQVHDQIRPSPSKQINSPFMKDIPALKSKSRNMRKKIYKFLQSHQPLLKSRQQNVVNLNPLLQQKRLPEQILNDLKHIQPSTINFLDRISFNQGVNLQQMRVIVNQQEQQVASLVNMSPLYRTAHKRKPLRDITDCHSDNNKRFLLTRDNQESGSVSIDRDFGSDISIFKGIDDVAVQRSSEELQPLKLRENDSFGQADNRSLIRSNSLFDEPFQMDHLSFF